MNFMRRAALSLRTLATGSVRSSTSSNARHSGPRKARIAFILGGGLTVTAYLAFSETVPYTERTQLVLPFAVPITRLVPRKELEIPDESILPADDPRSIRVRRIGNEITDALRRGVEEAHSDHGVIPSWVRKKLRPSTEHLESLEWEVLVARGGPSALCLPGGKIVVYTGWLETFATDAEVATAIGHEVAHAVARHREGYATRILLLVPVLLIIYCLWPANFLATLGAPVFGYAMHAFYLRREELEADYIGLILLATAGYDPRVAVMLWEKMSLLYDEPEHESFGSTHPSSMKRAWKLAQPEVMGEALFFYRQSLARRRQV